MSVSVTLNGSTYTIPSTRGETGWATQVTTWIQSVSSNTLQKTGGTFTLTADINFGSSYGLTAKFFSATSYVALAEIATPSTPSSGTLDYAKSDNKRYYKNDAGTEYNLLDSTTPPTTAGDLIVHNGTTNVRLAVGSDGQTIVADSSQTNKLKWATMPVGNKNYITYGTFENNASTGWNKLTATLSSLIPTGAPTVGTAASVTTLASTNTNPLAGSYSLSIAASSGFTAGQGVITDAYTIDREDLAKVMTGKFYYEAVTNGTGYNYSGTSSNTFAIYIYDTANTAWIQPAGVYGMTQSSGSGYVTFTFQTPSNMTSFRLAIIAINATSSNTAITIDDVVVGPQTAPIGAVVTDWQPYTVSVTGSVSNPTKGTTTVDQGYWRRVGDSIEIRYEYLQTVAGSAGSGAYIFSLPTGVTIDTAKISAAGNNTARYPVVGTALTKDNAGDTYAGSVVVRSSTGIEVWLGKPYNTSGDLIFSSNTMNFSNTSLHISFIALIPVSGWSSNVQMSNDTDTRVVVFRGTNSAGTSCAANTDTAIPFTASHDSHAAWSTDTYTVKVSGKYRVSSALRFAPFSASAVGGPNANNLSLQLWKNGSAVAYISYVTLATTTSVAWGLSGSDQVDCVAGDTLKIYVRQDSGASQTLSASAILNFLSIERISGPSVIASTETVSCRYTTNTAMTISTATTAFVDFEDKTWDSHGAVLGAGSGANTTYTSTWRYVCGVSGLFDVKAAVTFASVALTAGTEFEIHIYKTGVSYRSKNQEVQANNTMQYQLEISDTVKCLAGDIISIAVYQASGGSLNTLASTNYNVVSINRVGNYV